MVIVRMIKNYLRNNCKTRVKRSILILLIAISPFAVKGIGTAWQCMEHGSIDGERRETIERRDFLVSKMITTPVGVLREMPRGISQQFQGEWALYSCSMLSAALSNIAYTYPDTKEDDLQYIERLIEIVISPELRRYDKERWNEDALTTLDGDESHISYLSHLAWMICGYKRTGGGNQYDILLADLCRTMNRRITQSKCFNLPTYPNEPIYIPDMLVAIVALFQYAEMNDGKYGSTVKRWVKRAKTEWIDQETGLLVSFLDEKGKQLANAPIKGSYAALNCSYLSYIDDEFAHEQYNKFKSLFWKDGIISGVKEYHDRTCYLGFDMDAGPIIGGLSPSGTAFAMGAVTYFADNEVRNKILHTAEKAGHTIQWNGKRHYALANVALVGEAIMLAMRTNYKAHR